MCSHKGPGAHGLSWMVFSHHVLLGLWLNACPPRDDTSWAGGDASGSLCLSSLASKVGFACWLHCSFHSGTVWRWGKIQLCFTGQKCLQSYCISKIIFYQMTSSCKFYFWRREATLVQKDLRRRCIFVCVHGSSLSCLKQSLPLVIFQLKQSLPGGTWPDTAPLSCSVGPHANSQLHDLLKDL